MYLFKNIFGSFFLPVPLGLLISFLGLFLLLFTSRQRAGKILASVGICFLALLSLKPISNSLLAPLENQYNPNATVEYQHPYSVKYVVVLAGGLTSSTSDSITSLLNDASLARLIEGIRIYRENPGSKLILSGGSGEVHSPEAKVMADVAKAIGVDKEDIMIESDSKDTKDQVRFIKSMVGDSPFLLVTSASHMPRSMAMFKKLGMNPAPAPAKYLVTKKKGLSIYTFCPSATSLRKSEIAFHEYIGILWAKLRGLI